MRKLEQFEKQLDRLAEQGNVVARKWLVDYKELQSDEARLEWIRLMYTKTISAAVQFIKVSEAMDVVLEE